MSLHVCCSFSPAFVHTAQLSIGFYPARFRGLKRLATGSPRVSLVGLGKTSFVASNTQQSTHLMSQRSLFPKTLLPKKIFMRRRIVFFFDNWSWACFVSIKMRLRDPGG